MMTCASCYEGNRDGIVTKVFPHLIPYLKSRGIETTLNAKRPDRARMAAEGREKACLSAAKTQSGLASSDKLYSSVFAEWFRANCVAACLCRPEYS
jgi:hypothetical protein